MPDSLHCNPVEIPDSRLYTVAQFHRNMTSHANGIWIGIAAFIATMAAFYAVFFAIAFSLAPGRENAPQPLAVVGMVLFFLCQFLILGGFCAMGDYFRYKCRVPCPHCAKQLDVGSDLDFAIAIHGCPHCHKPLFQEWSDHSAILPPPADTSSAQGDFTFAEIAEAKKKRRQLIKKRLIIATIPAIVVLGLTSAALWIRHDLLTTKFGDQAADVANILRFVPAAIVLVIGFFFACFRPSGAFPKCGGCANQLIDAGDWTRATGNCTKCGRRVFRDAPLLRSADDLPDSNGIQHSQLEAWRAQYHWRTGWLLMSIIGAGMCALVWLVYWWYGISWRQKEAPIGAIIMLVSGMLILILLVGWLEHRLTKWRCCPHCKKSLLGWTGLIQATGNCYHCGQRVLAQQSNFFCF